MLKKILFVTLTILLGAVFIISGYTKGGFPFLPRYSSPIEPFEFTFVDLGVANWRTAPFIARLMIGLEFFIGLILILNVRLRKVGYRLAIAVLGIFCIYLTLMMLAGNNGNCGCFGTVFTMTPFWALMKNVVMILVLLLLYKFHTGWDNKYAAWVVYGALVVSLAMPFILNAVELDYSKSYLNKPEENYKLELDSLYNNARLNVPPKTLSQGKHIIAFMSLSCPHCRIAAKKIRIMHERNPEISFYFVLNGDDEKLKPFFDDTHTEGIPHCMLLGRPFVYLAGTNMPAIYLVNNSMVEHDVNYIDLDQGEIEAWMKK
ncbi:MAG: hypothetical protein JWO09_2616 [Bacteroidetes bacterium]|nr:hypothetical protein [Bacteroidota bacterium]